MQKEGFKWFVITGVFMGFIFLSNLAVAQATIKLKKGVRIDTLHVWLDDAAISDNVMRPELKFRFDSIINKFNNEGNSFKVKIDSLQKGYYLDLKMGDIKYVSTGRSVLMTGVNVVLYSGTVLFFPFFPFYVPLLPATYCTVKLSFPHNQFIDKPIMRVNPSGYFTKIAKQKTKFKIKFDRSVANFLNSMNKRNKEAKSYN